MDPNNNHHKLMITVVILVILVGFGFYISQNTAVKDSVNVVEKTNFNSDSSQNSSTRINGTTVPATPIISPQQKIATVKGIYEIEITGCVAKPSSINAKQNSTVKFINKDTINHTISFGQILTFTVKATSDQNMSLKFVKTLGNIKFDCDGKKEVGSINVVQ